jgi:hypothetical protein
MPTPTSGPWSPSSREPPHQTTECEVHASDGFSSTSGRDASMHLMLPVLIPSQSSFGPSPCGPGIGRWTIGSAVTMPAVN